MFGDVPFSLERDDAEAGYPVHRPKVFTVS